MSDKDTKQENPFVISGELLASETRERWIGELQDAAAQGDTWARYVLMRVEQDRRIAELLHKPVEVIC